MKSCIDLGCPSPPQNSRQNHCAAEGCHQNFLTVEDFDKHRLEVNEEESKCAPPWMMTKHLRMRQVNGLWGTEASCIEYEALLAKAERAREGRQKD